MSSVRIFLALLVLGIAIAAPACSVADSSDMKDLEGKIAALPPTTVFELRSWAFNRKVIDWLKKKSPFELVAEIECDYTLAEGGRPIILVKDLIRYLEGNTGSVPMALASRNYKEVLDLVTENYRKGRNLRLADEGKEGNCRTVLQAAYEPDRVAADVLDSNQYSVGEFAIAPGRLSHRDIANELIISPVMPPGGAALLGPEIFAMLCALGPNGCPDEPTAPAGTPDNDPGDHQ